MSSEKTTSIEDVKEQFDASLNLLKILNEYSAKLTGFAKAICRSLNLTEDIKIVLVFGHFYEHEVKKYVKPIAEVKTIVDERIEKVPIRGFV